jgi:hypothetical protein
MDSKVELIVRKEDVSMVEAMLPELATEFT